MYEDIYNKIIEYLKENSGVFYTIVNKGNPMAYKLYVYKNTIHISIPNNCIKTTSTYGPIYKKDFDNLYPLFLEYLECKDLKHLKKQAHRVSFKSVYWIGLFFELKSRGII